MKVLSINVALPRDISVDGRTVSTGIFKEPVSGAIKVRRLNLDGDRQADLRVHGGPDKAVYVYPSEHYEFWREELRQDLFGWGAFGENLTVEGVFEDSVSIGDSFRIGTAVFQVTQPRLPCFKLAAKLQREDIIKRFFDSRRTGFYVRVLKEGELKAGDSIEIAARDPLIVTIREITDVYADKRASRDRVKRVLSVEALAEGWRQHFRALLS